jgi:8-oxo-dGTP pyrophosphatase MutT (NUDIX family)
MSTATVTSSGGVIFRMRDGRPEVALIARNNRSVWGLPKGLVEKGETLEEAALREVREETGLTGAIIEQIGQIDYWFYWRTQKTRYHKFVHFFLIECTGGDIAQHDWEVEEVRWFPIEEAITAITYKSERAIVEKAKAMIEKQAA